MKLEQRQLDWNSLADKVALEDVGFSLLTKILVDTTHFDDKTGEASAMIWQMNSGVNFAGAPGRGASIRRAAASGPPSNPQLPGLAATFLVPDDKPSLIRGAFGLG